MVSRITYLGCEDGSPPVHRFQHPTTGDWLGFNIGRPILFDPAKCEKPEDTAFYQSVIDACTADDHFRVEDVAEAEIPIPVGAVTQYGYSPGMGLAPEYVAPPPIGDPAAAAAASAAKAKEAKEAESHSGRRSKE